MNSNTLRTCARFTVTTMVMTGLALIAVSRWLWRHRQQIAAALVRAVVALVVAAEAAHAAGRWARRELLVISDQAAALTAAQPLRMVAPITAGIAALRAALERLVARLYPAMA